MSMKTCINRAVAGGYMSPEKAKIARELFDEQYAHARLNLGDAEALAKARDETLKILKHVAAQTRRQKLMQAQRAMSIVRAARAATTTAGKGSAFGANVDIARAMLAHVDFDDGVHGVANIAKRRESIRGILHAKMADFLEKHRRDLLGRVRNKAELADILNELHGVDSKNASAKEMAKSWAEAAETARRMFNQAGGDIPKLEGWALPQSHNAIAVRARGFDDWFKDIREAVDLAKMKNHSTGRPFTEQTFKAAAREAFDAITTDGWAKRSLGGAYGQKLANRHADHRFFVFKNADAWLSYHEKYGEGDVFSVMMGHLDGMARDIAALQILGPNPTAMLRYMGDVVEQDMRKHASATGAATDALESHAAATRRQLETMYEHYSGAASAPINGKSARTFAGVRSVLQSAQLGAAALSAFADLGFHKMATEHIGIPYRKMLARHVSLLNPANIEDKKIAVRLGLIADGWAEKAVAQQRYLGEVSGPEVTSRLADIVMRVSGLSPWTNAGRWAFGMEFSGFLADNAGKAMRDLPEKLRSTFEHYGISAHDWDVARKTPMMEHKGAEFLRPADIGDEATALKFLDMLHTETEFAVPSTSLRGKSWLLGDAKPGTLQGEAIRSTAMYKNFAVTLMATHYRRMMAMPTGGKRGKYFAQLILTTTLMGGLAMQLKEIAKGRDPRDMTTPAFWGAALMQGGGMGIFGDFLFSQKNRYDKGLAQTIAGPVVGLGADVVGLLNENAAKALAGDDTKVMSGVVDLVERYMPGSSLWYLRAGMQNLLFDELRRLVDPDADARLRRIEKRYKKDYGQEAFWSRANDSLRLPDLSAALGE